MAVYPNIKFYRRQEAPSNPQEGYIWFDVTNKRLKIYKSNGWEDYSGKLVDASFASNTLTITKQDGTSVSVDLSGLTTVDNRISAAINNLDATVGSTSFSQNTNSAVTTAHVAVQVVETNGKLTKVTVAEKDIASASTLSSLTNTVSDLSDAIDVIKGSDAGSIRDIAVDVLTETLVKDNALDAYDTLQEMSEWIKNHPENAAAMNTKVSNLETAVNNLQKADSVTTFGGKTGAITLKSNSTTNGTVNFAMNNNELTGTVYGLGSLAYKSSLTKSDVGLGNVTNLAASGYLTDLSSNTTNAVSITVGGTTKNITAATMKASLGLGSAAYTASTAYATAAQGGKADTALQAENIASGSANGTISVKGTNVAVKGLGSAAYTASTAYATAAQGTLATNALQKISTSSNYLTIGNKSKDTNDGNKYYQSIDPVMGTFGGDNGLATTANTAAYVSTYVDTVFSWAEY